MSVSNRAFDHFSQGVLLFSQDQHEQSICHFSKAVERDPDLHAAWLSRGAAWIKVGDVRKAREDFSRAVELKPDDPRGYHFRGLTYLHEGEREQAKADFDRAIDLDDRYGPAYYARGTALSEMGDLDRAGRDMEMAARIGEANLQGFADHHNIWRTKFDKVAAFWDGERPADIGVTPDLRSWLDS